MKLTPELMQQFKYELARREFFYYCHLQAPDFYRKDRDYLVELCNTLQEFYEDSDAKVLIMNMPPRHGKSRQMDIRQKPCRKDYDWFVQYDSINYLCKECP